MLCTNRWWFNPFVQVGVANKISNHNLRTQIRWYDVTGTGVLFPWSTASGTKLLSIWLENPTRENVSHFANVVIYSEWMRWVCAWQAEKKSVCVCVGATLLWCHYGVCVQSATAAQCWLLTFIGLLCARLEITSSWLRASLYANCGTRICHQSTTKSTLNLKKLRPPPKKNVTTKTTRFKNVFFFLQQTPAHNNYASFPFRAHSSCRQKPEQRARAFPPVSSHFPAVPNVAVSERQERGDVSANVIRTSADFAFHRYIQRASWWIAALAGPWICARVGGGSSRKKTA